MTVGIRDGIKLVAISVVIACAVFVCTFFIGFYFDALAVREEVEDAVLPLYEAQLLTAKFTCLIAGLCLSLVSVVLVAFYIKLYLDSHAKQIGILKALGLSDFRIASGFWVFGLSVLLGAAVGFGGGFAVSPLIYDKMGGDGLPEIAVNFHAELLFFLVILPFLCFSAYAVLYAYLKLRLPVSVLLRGRTDKEKKYRMSKRERAFLTELFFASVKSRPALAFFVAFACFCFSSMLQMSFSMQTLASDTMGGLIAMIGIVLAACSMLLAMTSIVRANAKTIAVMRASGYGLRSYWAAVLGGYRIFAYIGFAVGTLYQYGLLKIMVNIVFADVAEVPAYSFDFPVFGIVLAVFAVLYELLMLLFTLSARKSSVRSFTAE